MVETSSDSNRVRFQNIFEQIDLTQRKTKIVCTLGPACWDQDMLVRMLDAGMNVARLNFSHGDHQTHGKAVANLREALKQRPDKTCAIMLDTKGPEIRTGLLVDHQPIELEANQQLQIVTDYSIEGDATRISCSYRALPETVQVGSLIYIGDGKLTCEVTEIQENGVMVVCKNAGKLGEKMNMNLPGAVVDLPTLTEKDETDLVEFGLKQGIDLVAASFVRKQDDIEYIRDLLGPRGANIKIIAKIENQEGLNNYDEILAASDGVMVARGDLGMEIPPEKVFIAQKWMIEKANIASKPIITATQMLESMISNPRPTRAEASDVANAVLDGTDAVMLSSESANGGYPIQAVTIMSKCCAESERCIDYKRIYNDIKLFTPSPVSTSEALAASAVSTIQDMSIDLIIVLTDTGHLARLVAKYRPSVPILACSVNHAVIRQLNITRGVIGFKIPSHQGTENNLAVTIQQAKERGLCKNGRKIISLHATDEETPDESSILKIIDVE